MIHVSNIIVACQEYLKIGDIFQAIQGSQVITICINQYLLRFSSIISLLLKSIVLKLLFSNISSDSCWSVLKFEQSLSLLLLR